MRIFSIELENFRMFEQKRVEFPAMFSVLIGENGSGKTSVLEAVGCFLQKALIESHEPFNRIHNLGNRSLSDQRAVRYALDDYNNFIRSKYLKISAEYSLGTLSLGSSNLHIYYNNGGLTHTPAALQDFHDFAKRSDSVLQAKGNPNLPVVDYFGSQYYRTEDWDKVDFMSNGSRIENGYTGSMSHFSINLKYFFDWYKTFSANAKEFDPVKFPEKAYISEHLACISGAINSAVPEWEDLRFDFAEQDIVGRLDIPEAKGQLRPYRDLSDGYRRVIGMVAIIAWRCVRLNPHFGRNAHLESNGIVLIDELDLHLHPNWQKRIVDDLKRTFPKIQFIVTTHSPFIVQSLGADEIISLDGIVDVNPSSLSLEDVAEEIMGVESAFSIDNEKTEELASKYLELLDKGKEVFRGADPNDEDAELDAMEAQISDPAVRAFLQMQRLKPR